MDAVESLATLHEQQIIDDGGRHKEIAVVLANGNAEERETEYAKLEQIIASAGGSSMESAVEFAAACVRPLIRSVLCAPASRVNAGEWKRASLLLYAMCQLDTFVICVQMYGKGEKGPLCFDIWTAPDTAFAAMVAKEPSEWTRDDAVVFLLHASPHTPPHAANITAICNAAGVTNVEWVGSFMGANPFVGEKPQPADRFVQLALLSLDLVRSERDELPEGILAGAGLGICWLALGRPSVAKALWEAGFLDVFQAMMKCKPMERISRDRLGTSGMFFTLKEVADGAQAAGIEVVGPLIGAGAVDIAISAFMAYQMLGDPEAANAGALQWGAIYLVEILLGSIQAKVIVSKLRSAGVDCFRYLLDHPLTMWADLGLETGLNATRIAARVWGRDDDGGLAFEPQDIARVVQMADHRGPHVAIIPMTASHGQSMLSLCVSDSHKAMLLEVEGFIPLLVDSLLLDPEHPRMNNNTLTGATDWEGAKGPVQRDYAEAIAQLAMYPPGREALLQDPAMLQALQTVAVEGWEDEARNHAQAALAALSGRQADAHRVEVHQDQRHVMLSYQWDSQAVVRRIVAELQSRGYRTWFDLDNMKGSTMDAMSAAVDNAAVMLSCISLAYKESANCRLEAQYGHTMDVQMIPLMMEEGYRATGWLGMLLGTKLYYNFHPNAVDTDDKFLKQIELVERDLGDKGKGAVGVLEGVPPSVWSFEPAPAPVSASEPGPAPSPVSNSASRPRSPSLSSTPVAAVKTPVEMASPGDQSFTPSDRGIPHTVSTTLTGSTEQLASLNPRPEAFHQLPQLVEKLLGGVVERDEAAREEAMAAKAEVSKLREELAAARVRSEMQSEMQRLRDIVALQARLENLRLAKLLTDAELGTIEDLIADCDEVSEDDRVSALIKLSAKMVADPGFSRQLRRKFAS